MSFSNAGAAGLGTGGTCERNGPHSSWKQRRGPYRFSSPSERDAGCPPGSVSASRAAGHCDTHQPGRPACCSAALPSASGLAAGRAHARSQASQSAGAWEGSGRMRGEKDRRGGPREKGQVRLTEASGEGVLPAHRPTKSGQF